MPTTFKARLEDVSTGVGIMARSCDEFGLERIQSELEPIVRALELSARMLLGGIQKAMTSGLIQKGSRPSSTEAAVTKTKTVCDHKDANHDRGACTSALRAAVTADAMRTSRLTRIARYDQ